MMKSLKLYNDKHLSLDSDDTLTISLEETETVFFILK